MRYYLIGMMGSGKSFLGKKIARIHNMPFIDLDILVEDKEGESVAEIFQSKGENHFREVENKVLYSTEEYPDAVVATGGGTPCFHGNMDWINRKGISIYLKTSIDILFERLRKEREHRPLLRSIPEPELKQHLEKLVRERETFYLQALHTFTTEELIVTPGMEEIFSAKK